MRNQTFTTVIAAEDAPMSVDPAPTFADGVLRITVANDVTIYAHPAAAVALHDAIGKALTDAGHAAEAVSA